MNFQPILSILLCATLFMRNEARPQRNGLSLEYLFLLHFFTRPMRNQQELI